MMNKYEKFVKELTDRTSEGSAKWKVADRAEIKNLFRDESLIFRQYECDWSPKPGTRLYFVEKQVPDYIEEHNLVLRDSAYELAVIDALGSPVFLIDRTYVAFKILYDLNSLIEQRTTEAEDFFEEFED